MDWLHLCLDTSIISAERIHFSGERGENPFFDFRSRFWIHICFPRSSLELIFLHSMCFWRVNAAFSTIYFVSSKSLWGENSGECKKGEQKNIQSWIEILLVDQINSNKNSLICLGKQLRKMIFFAKIFQKPKKCLFRRSFEGIYIIHFAFIFHFYVAKQFLLISTNGFSECGKL